MAARNQRNAAQCASSTDGRVLGDGECRPAHRAVDEQPAGIDVPLVHRHGGAGQRPVADTDLAEGVEALELLTLPDTVVDLRHIEHIGVNAGFGAAEIKLSSRSIDDDSTRD